MKNNQFSEIITVFQGRTTPEEGFSVGYGALLKQYDLQVPIPNQLALISKKHKQYETAGWLVFTSRHQPEDSLAGHLTFALKYEGIDLGVLKKLFEKVPAEEIAALIAKEPTGCRG